MLRHRGNFLHNFLLGVIDLAWKIFKAETLFWRLLLLNLILGIFRFYDIQITLLFHNFRIWLEELFSINVVFDAMNCIILTKCCVQRFVRVYIHFGSLARNIKTLELIVVDCTLKRKVSTFLNYRKDCSSTF
jgi:hypothetical protein